MLLQQSKGCSDVGFEPAVTHPEPVTASDEKERERERATIAYPVLKTGCALLLLAARVVQQSSVFTVR